MEKKVIPARLNNQSGAVLVEFGVLLPLFFVMMLFLIICYDMINRQIEMQIESYTGMRKKTMSINNVSYGGGIQLVECRKEEYYVIPRGMQKMFTGIKGGRIVYPLETKVCSYAGVMRGVGRSSWDTASCRGGRFVNGMNNITSAGCR